VSGELFSSYADGFAVCIRCAAVVRATEVDKEAHTLWHRANLRGGDITLGEDDPIFEGVGVEFRSAPGGLTLQ